MSHYKNTCPVCGAFSQCRCPGPKEDRRQPCAGCRSKYKPEPKGAPAVKTLEERIDEWFREMNEAEPEPWEPLLREAAEELRKLRGANTMALAALERRYASEDGPEGYEGDLRCRIIAAKGELLRGSKP